MSFQSDKRLVEELRHKKGLTLQAIANQLGRSVYWVNARLNKKYEPKRQRKVASDDQLLDGQADQIDNEALSGEVRKVRELRSEGLTYEQIATSLNRSVYWVHTRLRKQYRPKGARAEKEFQELRVIPFLQSQGHSDLRQYTRIEGNGIRQEADIVSTYLGRVCITEVKMHITHHQLQTAIGQLLLHRTCFKKSENPLLQIALPLEVERKKIPDMLLRELSSREDIQVVFVD